MKWLLEIARWYLHLHYHDFKFVGQTERMPLISDHYISLTGVRVTTPKAFGHFDVYECDCGKRRTERIWELS